MTPTAEELTTRIAELAGSNWIHPFSVDGERQILSPESYAYRRRVLEGVFASLLRDRSALVLDEASGIYPALIHRAGATEVAASSANEATRRLMTDAWAFLGVPGTAIDSRLIAFSDGEPYVDARFGAAHDFLVVLNQIWPLYRAAGDDFDAIAEACAYLVTDGLVLDWTDAEWAKPPPPPEYNRTALVDALRRKFEHVCFYSDWLVVATGKLPGDPQGSPG